MRAVIVSVNLTLDGYLCGPDGELDWMIQDPEMNIALTDELRNRADTMLAGRKTHEEFEGFFQEQAADPDSPAGLVDFATWMVQTPKVVFSRTVSEVGGNATVASGNLADEIGQLRDRTGGGLLAFGGVEFVQELGRAHVVDEYWIKLYPVALGAGRSMFAGDRTGLELIESRQWESGILTLKYRAS